MVRLLNLIPQSEYKLFLEFDDGVSGVVDLSNLVGKGVFGPLNDPAVFEIASVGKHGEVRWTDDLELCSDALYLQLTGKSAEELFPNLKAPADA